jgi:hypothetical protein
VSDTQDPPRVTLTEAEREACLAGADACNFLIRDSSMPEKWRAWEKTLRLLAEWPHT